MAFLGIRVPLEIARRLSGISVPGQKEAPGRMHITILDLGDDVPVDQIATATNAIFNVLKGCKPIPVETSLVSCFDSGEGGGYPIICRVESSELHKLREQLKIALDEAGVAYSKKYPEYVPHVTLAYSKEKVTDQLMDPVGWTVAELVLWGGDNGDDKLTVTFPLSLGSKKTKGASFRAMIRIAGWHRR